MTPRNPIVVPQEHVLLPKHRVPTEYRARTPVGDGEPIRVGMIGVGGMGSGHLQRLLTVREEGQEKLDVVAVADPCAKHRRNAMWRIRHEAPDAEPVAYVDYKELLARDDVHAVFVATPEHWHATLAVEAIAAGKDVYVEKPMAFSIEEAVWLSRVHEHSDAVVQVGTQYMMHPKFRDAHQLVADGVIGTPVWSSMGYGRNDTENERAWMKPIDESIVAGETLDWELWCGPLGRQPWDTKVFHWWRRYRKYSSGIIGDLLSHILGPMLWVVDQGLPIRATGQGAHIVDKEMENHDQMVALLEFESGHVRAVDGSVANSGGLPWAVYGHQADILLGGSQAELLLQSPYVDEFPPEIRTKPVPDDIHTALRLDFLSAVRSRGEVSSPVWLGVAHTIAVEMIARALWSRRAVRFDPTTFRMFTE
ncbi:MAG: Gfo/Idh/MocA family oxidoreductase [Planctomycetota bacterium]